MTEDIKNLRRALKPKLDMVFLEFDKFVEQHNIPEDQADWLFEYIFNWDGPDDEFRSEEFYFHKILNQ